MINGKLLPLLLAVSLCSCATVAAPSSEDLATADYGGAISQTDAENLAKDLMSALLKDPYSAVYTCSTPEKGWRNDDIFAKYKKHYGYVMHCMINAKNSFGAYGGAKPYDFVINSGQIVAAYGQQEAGKGVTYMGKIK